MSEAAKYRSLIEPYCQGVGLDVGSQGAPMVPWAWQLDLPEDEFAYYNSNNPPHGPIQLRGHADKLPVESKSLDWLGSSHVLEDYLYWGPILIEWTRVIKSGGYLVILIPDKTLWNAALKRGQPPNCAHKHEGRVGELSTYAEKLGVEVLHDQLTDQFPDDYTIMAVFRKR